jgi:hypothetical protein
MNSLTRRRIGFGSHVRFRSHQPFGSKLSMRVTAADREARFVSVLRFESRR